MRVAAVQMKFAATIKGNLTAMERALKDAQRQRADAVLFPECALTGYRRLLAGAIPKRDELRRALDAVGAMAAAFGMNLLVGTPLYRGQKLYNALVVFDRRGRAVHCYAKCHLTELDRRCFAPGNAVALFKLDGVWATAIICHERRYPELVRLAAMAGARILFHPNAGLDALSVSKRKRCGRDGISARAFENAIYYVFANSVGAQGGGKWSAGDSKIVAPDERVLALADNRRESVISAELDLTQATGVYAQRGMAHPKFLAASWRKMVAKVKAQAKREARELIRSWR
ncbi:MAG TPA: carbon-nitrogen hydrolase family protein [Planctomycetota bacterium]|nr:carbon-nitrogen hydrolase family protein [Planctomycetota bacterium]